MNNKYNPNARATLCRRIQRRSRCVLCDFLLHCVVKSSGCDFPPILRVETVSVYLCVLTCGEVCVFRFSCCQFEYRLVEERLNYIELVANICLFACKEKSRVKQRKSESDWKGESISRVPDFHFIYIPLIAKGEREFQEPRTTRGEYFLRVWYVFVVEASARRGWMVLMFLHFCVVMSRIYFIIIKIKLNNFHYFISSSMNSS